MAREVNRLNALTIPRIKAPGYYSDGAGLYLQISPYGTRSWIFRYTLAGRAREMGLGAFGDVSLAEARALAAENRKMVKAKKDPIEERDALHQSRLADRAKRISFDDASAKYIEIHQHGWKSDKQSGQWRNSLKTYASPFIGKLSVADVSAGLVLQCLEPIWTSKTETATRVRGRIEKILDWAKASGFRSGENPARWKGHLEHSLPDPNKIAVVRNHPALPYSQIYSFIKELRQRDGLTARALEFGILTATRSGDIRGATWSEIDFDTKIWSISSDRMKGEMGKVLAEKIHRIPLSTRALEILQSRRDESGEAKPGDFIFPTQKNRPLSDAAISALIKRMNEGDSGPKWIDAVSKAPVVPHGFRSTFRDWAAECTYHDSKICEKALAHVLGDETERAYQRGDLLEKRRLLMEDWAVYCTTKQAPNVVPIRSNAAA